MIKKFIPFYDKIEISPLEHEGFFKEGMVEEVGTVTAVGKHVKFVKVGDTVYFSSWGLNKARGADGVEHFIVPESGDFILGKEEKHVAKK